MKHRPADGGSVPADGSIEGRPVNRATMAFGILAATAATSFAQPVQWRVEDGGNGHWYQAFARASRTWTQCRMDAESMGGTLAIPASSAENQMCLDTWMRANLSGSYVFLGGYQDRSSPKFAEPNGGWRWVSGESWAWTNWHPVEPNDYGEISEDFLSMRVPDGLWNDVSSSYLEVGGIIIEWSADCNADGLVDKGQILSGQLQDLDANGVLDICELPCAFSQQPSTQSLVPGGSATFTATFARAGHAYQWRRNGVALASGGRIGGTTTPTLTIASVGPADQGTYDCVATGVCGSVVSSVATLSCVPVITGQPQGGTFVGGQPVTLSVVASAGASYRWRRDGVNLVNGNAVQGVTTPTLTINADEPFQSGSYTVAVTNPCGTTVSEAAVVEVTCPADFNQDGGTDGQDLFDFFEAWAGGETSADLNFDGGTDGGDVTAFFTRWERGC